MWGTAVAVAAVLAAAVAAVCCEVVEQFSVVAVGLGDFERTVAAVVVVPVVAVGVYFFVVRKIIL